MNLISRQKQRLLPLLLLSTILCSCSKADYRIDLEENVLTTVDEKFLSFALDSAQLVGGMWWIPDGYSAIVEPYNFDREKLKNLTKELLPAYIRFGGSEADTIYYHMQENALEAAPEAFKFILSKEQWDKACDFAKELDLDILFTLNAGPGPRNADKSWQGENAKALIEYSQSIECPVKVWELGNEINGFFALHGLFTRTGGEYAQDIAEAKTLLAEVQSAAKLAGPSSAYWPGEGELGIEIMPTFLEKAGSTIDILTWHYYPQQSERCPLNSLLAEEKTLLNPDHLDEILSWNDEILAMKAEHAPNAEFWLGETGHAQCGGQQEISGTYVSLFWWLDQLGLAAQSGNKVVIRQTLTGADYQLIDETSLKPTPDYYGSVLWKRLMGSKVLSPILPENLPKTLRAYAHCHPQMDGSVTLLLINLSETDSFAVDFSGRLGKSYELYSLSAGELLSHDVLLNRQVLSADKNGNLSSLDGEKSSGAISIAPLSNNFLHFEKANISVCDP